MAPPPGNPRFPDVDAMRALAILAVVAYHTGFATNVGETAWYGSAVTNLNAGVQLFFVISAFLLYRPLFAARYLDRPRTPTRVYLRRRVLRIVPAYWLALTVLAIYPGLVGVFTGDWWVYYGFMQVYDMDHLPGGLPQAWSLCVEALFYVVLPVYALAMARVCRGRERGAMVRVELGMLVALALALLAWQALTLTDAPAARIPGQLFWFVPGLALAVVSVVLREGGGRWRPAEIVVRMPWIPWTLAGLAFAAVVATNPVERPSVSEMLMVNVLLAATVTLLLIPAISGTGTGAIRRMLSWRLLAWLGLVSYGIFLWHVTAMLWLGEHGVSRWVPGQDFAVLTAMTLLVATVLAAASYYGVERRLLRLKR